MVFQWHGDTYDFLPNCTRLALLELCPNQACRFRGNAYVLQFHLNITESIIKDWVDEHKDELNQLKGRIDANKIVKQAPKNAVLMKKITDEFYSGFAKLINNQ